MSQCDAKKVTRCLNVKREMEDLQGHLENFEVLDEVEVYLASDDDGRFLTDDFIAIDFSCCVESLDLISRVSMDIRELVDSLNMVADVDLYINTVERNIVSLRMSIGVYESSNKVEHIIHKKVIDVVKIAFSGYL